MNDFVHSIKYYPGIGFGYLVHEIVEGAPVLRLVSGGDWIDPWFAGLRGLVMADKLKRVAREHSEERVAA